ncbi:MAG TPA: 2,3-bisphosphoglycerate-independent phosphoglycerate mutase [Atribacterota bacterium]|nr:2,3-bisphosphoglycerate-independent phosphoglycerate mutase [Atribacterota bacterium]
MIIQDIIKELSISTESKIVLLVADGVGDLPSKEGKTTLEYANTPNLDELAARSVCGLTDPISRGITPGSGPAHVSLFGYDPIKCQIGRGVLEALGIDIELTKDDLACRGNFATIDSNGLITDRRAGRISTETNQKMCSLLQDNINEIDGVKVIIKPGKEHRFVVVFRGKGLEDGISDADPQLTGKKIKYAQALRPESKESVRIVNQFIDKALEVLEEQHPANAVLLRGIAKHPGLPSMNELFKLKPAAIATYPMYRGLAKLVGMDVVDTGETIADEFVSLKDHYQQYDFFYVHIKKTDSYGEDGNYDAKVKIIEELDSCIPQLLELNPDVIAITGDHSTPAALSAHSWHPNPFLLYSRYIRVDEVKHFSENEFVRGGLGRFPAMEAIPLMLANALKLNKYGA